MRKLALLGLSVVLGACGVKIAEVPETDLAGGDEPDLRKVDLAKVEDLAKVAGCNGHTWVAGSYGPPPSTRTILNIIYAPSTGSPFTIGGALLKTSDASFHSGVVLGSVGSAGTLTTASETTVGMPGYIDQHLWSMSGNLAGDLYVAGTAGAAYKRTGSSGAFTKLTSTGIAGTIYAAWAPPAGAAVFLGGQGGKLSYVDGTTVKVLDCKNTDAACVNPDVYGLWGTDSATYTVYAVGKGGVILRAPGAQDPTKETSPTTSNLNSVWGASATEIYAVGSAGTIVKSMGGTGAGTWTSATSGTTVDLHGVGGDAGLVYAVGGMGTVLCSADQGATFTKINIGALPDQDLTAVHGAGGKVMIVGRASQIWLRQ